MRPIIHFTALCSLFTFAWSSSYDFESQCASLARQKFENTTIYATYFVPGGTNTTLVGANSTCTNATSTPVLVDLCRLTAYAATSDRSGINFEVWLPSNWTGRFISHGNGGLSGCIDYASLAYSTSYGFAAVSANSGHNGTSGGAFYKNEDVVADFVWRSLHTGVVLGKGITDAYYGKPHSKSYYLGCSTGGRQGFKAVQDFPEDFDGVVAGAPAFSFNNLTSESGWFYNMTGPPGSPTWLSPAQWGIVTADIMKQCDKLDGYADNIIEDPLMCKYDPSGLVCSPGANQSACFTDVQITTIKRVYSAIISSDGSVVYPRFQPGGEQGRGSVSLLSGLYFPYTQDWFRYVVYNDPTWDPATLSLKDMSYSAKLNPENAQTWEGDLSAFKNRGAKVLTYHGQMDPLISSDNSPRYYEHVVSTMNMQPSDLDSFYRFFRIAGMGHCSGGAGPWEVGQSGGAWTADPDGNVLTAIVRWVEEGKAPDTIMGTKYINDTKAAGIQYQRKHCRYPYRNQYSGNGDPTKPDSWECVMGERFEIINACDWDLKNEVCH